MPTDLRHPLASDIHPTNDARTPTTRLPSLSPFTILNSPFSPPTRDPRPASPSPHPPIRRFADSPFLRFGAKRLRRFPPRQRMTNPHCACIGLVRSQLIAHLQKSAHLAL